MATTCFDTNVNNYTTSELLSIAELNSLDPHKITTQTNSLINKFRITRPEVADFFIDIQKRLLTECDGDSDGYGDSDIEEGFTGNMDDELEAEGGDEGEAEEGMYLGDEKQVRKWLTNEALPQSDKTQQNKITNRQQKIDLFGNEHLPMAREQLGINDTFQVPIKQDSLNPNLKNTITRFVNLDSQFRQSSNGIESLSTDYTLDLSDTLKDVLSMRLYSYQIPFTWYAIDSAYGNTCFWIIHGDYTIPITMQPGNYSPTEFVTALNAVIQDAGFNSVSPVTYNSNNGKITLTLYGLEFSNTISEKLVEFTVDATTIVTFYDFIGDLKCEKTCINRPTYYLNNTLGWIMGFRAPRITVDPSGNTAIATLNLNGPKYLMLVIDDYNQNHVNNGIVSITQLSNKLKLPNYYSPDMPYTCLRRTTTNTTDDTGNGLLVADKYVSDFKPVQIMLPSAPRTLTQSQIYTINEINKNRNNTTNYLSTAPTNADILAIIPVKVSRSTTGEMLVEFSGSLQDNIRTYFGPVNIDRMSVKLLDDKGNVINLNGADWSVTLICECLYQY
jgi:hypothetical protein